MTLLELTARQILASRRWLLILALGSIVPLVAMLARARGFAPEFAAQIFPQLFLGVVVPLLALVVSVSAVAGDIEEGTAVYLLCTPVGRGYIFATRYMTAIAVTVLVATAAGASSFLILSGSMEDTAGRILASTVAVAVGGVLYTALFLALALYSRRGVMLGLLYALVWENILARNMAGARTFSIREYMVSIQAHLSPDPSATASLTLSAIVPVACVMLAASIALGISSLRNFQATEKS